jgi:uncharacterized membrane protein
MLKSHFKSAAKALTWRTVAAAEAFVIAYLITGSAHDSFSLVGITSVSSTILYYGHERIWTLFK